MFVLQFKKVTPQRIVVEVQNENCELLLQRPVNRYNRKDVEWLMRLTEWTLPDANRIIVNFLDGDGEEELYQVTPGPQVEQEIIGKPAEPDPESIPFFVYVRELTQLRQHALSFRNESSVEAFRTALFDTPGTYTEPIIEWSGTDRLCCLDIDYHSTQAPTKQYIDGIVSRIRPQPYCWHYSHGDGKGHGAKLYFSSHPGYSAVELASVAGLQWVELDPRATFDLTRSTRHPGFKRTRDDMKPPVTSMDDIHVTYGSGDVSAVRRLLLSEVESSDVEDYLASRGWRIGLSLPHTECPIDPTEGAKQPVYIGDRGILCLRCRDRGLGGKVPGFRSYASLIGGKDNRIRTMVKNFVHLEHARIILQNLYPTIPETILDNVYRVMLKIVHSPDDPRINLAMLAGKGFIRITGQWVSVDGTTSLADGTQRYVQSLPAVLIPKEDGYSVNIPALTAFLNAGDLSEYGYQDVSFLRGCKVYGQYLPYPNKEIVKMVCRKEFVDCIPRYLNKSIRMEIEDAWELLEQEFPGINRTYVKLLIAAKGASEGRLAQCPFLMITGVSSAGKSTTVHIAAGICGDKADEPIYHPDPMRFRAALMDGAKQSGFICINEVFKMSANSKLSATQALDPMLSLTEDSRSHVLYVGTVPFGRLPVFVLTDINCPSEVTQDYQLTRRFTFYRLDDSIEWTNSLVTRNIKPHEFRLISPEHNRAADTILSDVIDEFFRKPTPLVEISRQLGIGVAEVDTIPMVTPEIMVNSDNSSSTENVETPYFELDERTELKIRLRKFHKLVCEASPLTGSHAQRYAPHQGWRLIERFGGGELLELWNEVCSGHNGAEWISSRICDAEDWGRLLGFHPTDTIGKKWNIVFQIAEFTNQGRHLYVRFRSTDSKKRPCWVNGNYV